MYICIDLYTQTPFSIYIHMLFAFHIVQIIFERYEIEYILSRYA